MHLAPGNVAVSAAWKLKQWLISCVSKTSPLALWKRERRLKAEAMASFARVKTSPLGLGERSREQCLEIEAVTDFLRRQ